MTLRETYIKGFTMAGWTMVPTKSKKYAILENPSHPLYKRVYVGNKSSVRYGNTYEDSMTVSPRTLGEIQDIALKG
jgi:hypothetical protein